MERMAFIIREIDLLNRVFGRILTTPVVDIGEASAIALALELENSVIILDDY